MIYLSPFNAPSQNLGQDNLTGILHYKNVESAASFLVQIRKLIKRYSAIRYVVDLGSGDISFRLVWTGLLKEVLKHGTAVAFPRSSRK